MKTVAKTQNPKTALKAKAKSGVPKQTARKATTKTPEVIHKEKQKLAAKKRKATSSVSSKKKKSGKSKDDDSEDEDDSEKPSSSESSESESEPSDPESSEPETESENEAKQKKSSKAKRSVRSKSKTSQNTKNSSNSLSSFGARPAKPAVFKKIEKNVMPFDLKITVEDWIQHFEDVTYPLNDDEKYEIFRSRMHSGTNFTWFETRRRALFSGNIHDWLRDLQKTFVTDPRKLRAAVMTRKQQTGKDAAHFVREMNLLCARYQPHMGILDKIAFISANVNPRYQATFRLLSCKDRNLEEIEHSLREAMQMMDGEAKSVHFGSDPQTQNAALTQNQYKTQYPTAYPSATYANPQNRHSAYQMDTTYDVYGKPLRNLPAPFFCPQPAESAACASFFGLPPMPTPSLTPFSPLGVYNTAATQVKTESPETMQVERPETSRTPKQGGRGRQPDDRGCFRCGKQGHMIRDCWSKPKQQEYNNSPKSAKPPVKCGFCGKLYHSTEECWTRKRQEEEEMLRRVKKENGRNANTTPVRNQGNGN